MKININKLNSSQVEYLNLKETKLNKNGYYYISRKEILKLQAIQTLHNLIRETDEVIFIGIDGMSGAGKTTFGKYLAEIFNGNLFHIDDFFQKPIVDELDETSKYGSNIDFTKIINTIINPTLNKSNVFYQPFDIVKHQHLDVIEKKYSRINIIEGSFSLHPKIIDYYQYKIFFKIKPIKQYIRILKRSGFKKSLQFVKRWIPNENIYNKKLQIEKKANIIIKN